MKKIIASILVLLVLAVFMSGCLSSEEPAGELGNTTEESDYDKQLREYLEEYPDGVNYTPKNNTEMFGSYKGYDFTAEEVTGMWENVERSSDDMMFNSDYTYRYQLDTSNMGSGWRQYNWYEGTWRIENGCILISLSGQGGYYEDVWMFTKNENGTMNGLDEKVFDKTKPITASSK